MIFTELSAAEQKKWSNIFTLTFSSHDINFNDVVEALSLRLLHFNQEVKVTIDEKSVQIVTFCISFLKDMSQQNDNTEIKWLTAVWSC